jgi:hypothetical protein
MHLYNLILAGLWLVIGGWLLIYQQLNPNSGLSFQLGDHRISYGWVALALCGYNIVRFVTQVQAIRSRREREEIQRRAELARRDREFRDAGKVPDPNFRFEEPGEQP